MHQSPAPEPASRLHPNPEFGAWVKHNPWVWITQVIALIGGIASGVYYITRVAGDTGDQSAERLIEFNHLLHLPLLLAAGIYLAFHLDDNDEGRRRTQLLGRKLFGGDTAEPGKDGTRLLSYATTAQARSAVRSFKIYFLLFIASMLIYYSWALKDSDLVHHFSSANHDEGDEHAGSSNSGLHIGAVVWPEHAASAGLAGPDRSNVVVRLGPFDFSATVEGARLSKKLINGFVEFVINTVGAYALLFCFLQMRRPQHPLWPLGRRGSGYALACGFGLLVPLLVLPWFVSAALHGEEERVISYLVVINWASGVLNAVVMMLLISRLDSKLVGLGSNLTGVLYAYAAVQALFSVFPPDGMIKVKVVTLYAVLFLKLFFFFIVHYALVQGRLFCYMVLAPQLARRRMGRMKTEWAAGRLYRIELWKSTGSFLEMVKVAVTTVLTWAAHRGVHFFPYLMASLLMVLGWFFWGTPSDNSGALREEIQAWLVKAHVFFLVFASALFFTRQLGKNLFADLVNLAVQRWEAIHSSKPRWLPPVQGAPKKDAVRPLRLMASINRFRTWFACMLFSLLAFYIVLCLAPKEQVSMVGALHTMALVALNTTCGLFLYLCFVLLARPLTCAKYEEDERRFVRFGWITWAAIIILLVATSARWFSQWQDFEYPLNALIMWKTFSGVVVSVVFALFIARFDGTQMWQHTKEIRWLLLYAAIQPLLITFDDTVPIMKDIMIITIAFALVLKVWLCIVVYRAMYLGGMVNYLLMFPEFDRLANNVFKNGFLVRNTAHGHHGGGVEIYEHGRLVFSGQPGFDHHTRPLFPEAIKDLMEVVAGDNCHVKETHGTWTVNVVFPSGAWVFRPHRDFSSREAAAEFRDRLQAQLRFGKVTYE